MVGMVAAAAFLALGVWSLLAHTTVTFANGTMTVNAKLAPWSRAVTASLIEIQRFEITQAQDGSYLVNAVLQNRGVVKLPFPLAPLPVKFGWNFSKKTFFPAPIDHAQFVATRLDEMKEQALRQGHDTYRT